MAKQKTCGKEQKIRPLDEEMDKIIIYFTVSCNEIQNELIYETTS